MIPQYEAAIPLFQLLRRRSGGDKPIVQWIIFAQFEGSGLRVQPDQPALLAFDNVEGLIGGAVQPVRPAEQFDEGRRPAGRTRRTGCGSEIALRPRQTICYVDCSESSLK